MTTFKTFKQCYFKQKFLLSRSLRPSNKPALFATPPKATPATASAKNGTGFAAIASNATRSTCAALPRNLRIPLNKKHLLT